MYLTHFRHKIKELNEENYRLYGIVFTASASGGPGGQAVNTTNSKATLHFDFWSAWPLFEGLTDAQKQEIVQRLIDHRIADSDGVIVITSQEERSWHQNRQKCLAKLKEALLQATRPRLLRDIRPPARVVRLMAARRKKEKSVRTAKKSIRRVLASED